MIRKLLALTTLTLLAADASADQWIVVTAPAYRAALAPLIEHRKAEGLHVVVVTSTDFLDEDAISTAKVARLRDHVHKLCRDHKGNSNVLLVGALDGDAVANAMKKVLPPGRGTAGRMKGQPSDNAFGCPDGGRQPTVAVGRFPARSEQEVKDMVARTLRYETDKRPSTWRHRITVLAGIPAYNPVVDRLVESVAMARFNRLAPQWTGRAIYTNPQSRFCVPDAELHSKALRYVEEGQAFTLYLGHSSAEGLYGGEAPFLNRDDWRRLKIDHGPGVFFTFGCNGCQLDSPRREGYGVAAIRNANGPVAVLGSHGICFAAMVQLGADGLFETCFSGPLPTRLADAWLAVERGVARGKIDELTYRMLDAVDGDSRISQAEQRQEHLEMFLLLGDPALKLPHVPDDVEVEAAEAIQPGEALTVRGKVPARCAGARVRLSLERSVGSVPVGLQPLPKAGPDLERVLLANHERANDFVVADKEVTAREGRFEARLDVPAEAPWPRLVLRIYAASDTAEAMTVRTIAVRKPR